MELHLFFTNEQVSWDTLFSQEKPLLLGYMVFFWDTSVFFWRNNYVYWDKPVFKKWSCLLGHICFSWNDHVYWDIFVFHEMIMFIGTYLFFKKWSCLLVHICFSRNDHVYWDIFTVIMLIGRHLFLNKLPFLGHLFIKKISCLFRHPVPEAENTIEPDTEYKD